MSSQDLELPDIPTGISKNEARILTRLAKGKEVLEVGSLLGFSTVLMARVAKRVYSIDKHTGYPDHDPKPTAPIYFENLDRYGVMDKVISFVGDAEMFLDGNSYSFDNFCPQLIFLDINGHYDITKRLVQTFLADWMDVEGVHLAIHDYGHPDWPGVSKAVNEALSECWAGGFSLRLVDTLVIIKAGDNY